MMIKPTKVLYQIYFLLLAVYLGLINITKIPESDLINYYERFLMVKEYDFFSYILIMGKEPFFSIYNYLLYYLTNGNAQILILLSTAISYWFVLNAIFIYYKVLKANDSILMFAIVITVFFPQLFSLSAHLIRQFMAASILLYAYVQKFVLQKKVWYYLLTAAFIHSTALLFIPLIYFKPLRIIFKLHTILIIALILVVVSFGLPFISSVILHLFGRNIITYVFSRVTNADHPLEPLSLLSFLVLGISVFIVLVLQYSSTGKKLTNNFPGLVQLSNIFLFYAFFILANIKTPEISVRFFFYTYFFFPLLVPLFFTFIKNNTQILRASFSFIMILFFIYRLEYGTWQYATLNELLLGSTLSFFING